MPFLVLFFTTKVSYTPAQVAALVTVFGTSICFENDVPPRHSVVIVETVDDLG